MYRVAETKGAPYETGPEYQVLDDDKHGDDEDGDDEGGDAEAVLADTHGAKSKGPQGLDDRRALAAPLLHLDERPAGQRERRPGCDAAQVEVDRHALGRPALAIAHEDVPGLVGVARDERRHVGTAGRLERQRRMRVERAPIEAARLLARVVLPVPG